MFASGKFYAPSILINTYDYFLLKDDDDKNIVIIKASSEADLSKRT